MRKIVIPVLLLFCLSFFSPVAFAVSEAFKYPVNEPVAWLSLEVSSTNPTVSFRYYLYDLSNIPDGATVQVSWANYGFNIWYILDGRTSEAKVTAYRQDGTFYSFTGFDGYDTSYSPVSIASNISVSVYGSTIPAVSHIAGFGASYSPVDPDSSGIVGDLDDAENDLIGSVTPGLNDTVEDLHISVLDFLAMFRAGFYVVSDTMSRFIGLSFFQGLLVLSLSIGIFASIVGVAGALVKSSRSGGKVK